MTTPHFININQALAPLLASIMSAQANPGKIEIVPVRAADEGYDRDFVREMAEMEDEDQVKIAEEVADLRRGADYLAKVASMMEMGDYRAIEEITTDRLIDAADELIQALDAMEEGLADLENVATGCDCPNCRLERSVDWSKVTATHLPVTDLEEEARAAVEKGPQGPIIKFNSGPSVSNLNDKGEEDMLSGIPLVFILGTA